MGKMIFMYTHLHPLSCLSYW